MHVHVDPDQVDQRQRADRPARPEPHALVDVLRARRSLLEHAHRVVEDGDQDPVDDEAGRVVARDRVLADALREGVGRVECGGRRELAADHLDEREHGRRVEEVHAGEALRPLEGGGDLGHRERGGVRRENGVGADDRLDPPEEVLLDREVLEHGLDHEIAVGERRDVGHRLE